MTFIAPSVLRTLIAAELPREQLDAAYGRFSSAKSSAGTNHLSVWFGPNVTPTIKQVVVSSDDTAGVLLYSKGFFTVVSNIKSAISTDQTPTFTGHLGDSLARIMPTEVHSDELLGEVFVLVQNSHCNDSIFNHRKATTHEVSSTLDGVEGAGSTFFGNVDLDEEPDLDDMSIVKLPTAIPLPFGHNIECTSASDKDSLVSLVTQLGNIDERLVTWAFAMHFSITQFDGVSLDHASLNINPRFFEPVPITPDLQRQIEVSLFPLVPTGSPAIDIHSRLSKVQDSNLDKWILANKTFCDPIVKRYTESLGANPQQGGTNQTPTQISVNVAKSATEEKNEVRKQKALATVRLLLGSVNTDSDEFVPATLREDYVDLVEEGATKAKDALRTFQQQFGEHIKNRRSNINSVIENKTNMPMGVLNLPFIAAFVHGHYGSSSMHDAQTVVGQNLTIFSFLPAGTETVGYKRVLDEANAVHGEQMVGETTSNATKISTNLFSSGDQRTYQNLLTAVANLHGALTFMIDPSEVSSSRIIKDLESLFAILVSHNFETWFNFHSTGTVTWLCHSILVDVHNVFRQAVAIASTPAYLRSVLENKPIKASEAVADLDIAFKTTVQKWSTATNQNALSSYNSEPSTWQLFNAGSTDASKKQRTDKKDKSKGRGNSWGSFDSQPPPARASNPNYGMLEVTNNSVLRSIPRLRNNKTPCHDFICKGRSCSRGRDCNYEHLSLRSDAADIDNLYRWATSTNGVTWIGPAPGRRGSDSSRTNNGNNNNNNNSNSGNNNRSGTTSNNNGTGNNSNNTGTTNANDSGTTNANNNGNPGSDRTTG